jgi:hypothetical protein
MLPKRHSYSIDEFVTWSETKLYPNNRISEPPVSLASVGSVYEMYTSGRHSDPKKPSAQIFIVGGDDDGSSVGCVVGGFVGL